MGMTSWVPFGVLVGLDVFCCLMGWVDVVSLTRVDAVADPEIGASRCPLDKGGLAGTGDADDGYQGLGASHYWYFGVLW